jgi:hypothetical protein
MPGNSWRDRLGQPGTGTPAAPVPPRAPAASPQLPSHLNTLLQQREQLQNNLRNLVAGGASGDPREAARFHVPTFAQRQAEQRLWEARRARQSQSQPAGPASPLDFIAGRAAGALPALPIRSGLRDFQQPVTGWLDARDHERQQLRDQARDRLAPLDRVAEPVRGLHRQVQDAGRQLRDLDQRLASEGLESDREALREMGADKLQAAESYLGRATEILDAPQRAVRKIDDFWQQRDNDICGAMDRFGSYMERSRSRLSAETGGSGDLFERMMRNRERALEQRREQQRPERHQEKRDQARRDRAQERKRTQEET